MLSGPVSVFGSLLSVQYTYEGPVQSPVCVGQGHTWKSIWRTVLAAVVLKALVINKVLVKTDLPNFRKKRIVSSP